MSENGQISATNDRECRYNPIYVIIVGGVIPTIYLATITVLYILIYRVLRQNNFRPFGNQNIFKQISQYFKKYEDDDVPQNREVKTTILLFLTVTAAYIVMIPSTIIFSCTQAFPQYISQATIQSGMCIYLLHPIINPLLYVYHISNIRKRGKGIIRKLVTWKTEEGSDHNQKSSSRSVTI